MEYIEKKKRVFFEGVEVAAFYARYPRLELERIGAFCERLAENAFSWFCNELCERAIREYKDDTDPDKRFRTVAYRYRLHFYAEPDGESLSLRCEASLARGKGEALARFEDTLCFDIESQLAVLPKQKKKRRG